MLSNRRRYFIELLHVIVIISILVVIALKSYQVVLAKAEVMGAVTGIFDAAKRDALVYLAMRGEFPQSTNEVFLDVLPKDKMFYESLSGDFQMSIDHGAVNVTFKNNPKHHKRFAGKTLTMRPVVQDDDPTGAVHWVCGSKRESGWKVFGIDRTDIEDRHIPAVLK